MDVRLPSPRLRLWAARLSAVAGALLGAYASFQTSVERNSSHSYQPLYWFQLALDAAAIALCGKRRFRFASAVWLGCSAFFHMARTVNRGSDWGLVAAVPLALSAALLVWPLLKASSSKAPMAALSGVWALVAALVVTAVDGLLVHATGAGTHNVVITSSFTALGLFAGCMIASRMGPLRWLAQLGTAALVAAAHASELGGGRTPASELAQLVPWMGLAAFALGLDWIRSGPSGSSRFLRAGSLTLAVSLPPLALAAAWTPLQAEAVVAVLARAAALALAAAIMPRVAGRGRPAFRSNGPVGMPPWPLAVVTVAVAAAAAVLVDDREPALIILAGLIPAFTLAVFRARITRALFFLLAGVPLMVAAVAMRPARGLVDLLAAGALAAVAVVAFFLSGPRAGRHFRWRIRWAPEPHPRVSLALAGVAGLGLFAWVGALAATVPEARSGLLASAGGAVPLPAPVLFQPPQLRDEPAPGRLTGSAVAIDPLGRGTWVVDEERDEVSLVGPDRAVKRFPAGAWPELLVVTGEGRVFVSCRQAGRIEVIDPDFQRRSIDVDDEVRGLALDASERRLYAGLLTRRELRAFDARTLEPLASLSLETDPRTVAVTALGVATLPDKGSAVEMADADLRRRWSVRLPSDESGMAWHGQALLPAGRDLLVLHAKVNTGLERPISSGGGYGGSVSEPVFLVATVLEGGRAPLVPPNARGRHSVISSLGVPDVSGAVLTRDALIVASRSKGVVEKLPLASPRGMLESMRQTLIAEAPGQAQAKELPRKEEEASTPQVASGQGMTGVALDGERVVTYAAFDRVLVSARVRDAGGREEVLLGAGRLDAQLARGRRLFFRNDRAISSAGLSCATCHVDGREDGLVWRFQGARLQTPSLTGRLTDTAPFNWHGTTKTLPDNIAQTIERLGGTGLPEEDTRALARYLKQGLRPVRQAPAGEPALVARGREVFHDRTVGCASCHDSTSGFTDGQAHDVETLSKVEKEELMQARAQEEKQLEAAVAVFDTPALRQLWLTAPYLHDGSAPSLEALVDGNRDRMGKTSHLSATDRRALVAYLRTL